MKYSALIRYPDFSCRAWITVKVKFVFQKKKFVFKINLTTLFHVNHIL